MIKLIMILSFVVGLASCTIENDGPTGPRGSDGVLDITNLFVSAQSNQWRTSQDPHSYYFTVSVPEVTENVINNGFVIVYQATTSSSANNWTQLPITNMYYDLNMLPYTIELIPWHGPGFVEVQYYDSHPTPLQPTLNADFKISIVEGYYLSSNATSEEKQKALNYVNNKIMTGEVNIREVR